MKKQKNKAKSLSEKRRLSKFGMWKTAPYGMPVDFKKWRKKK